MKFNFKKISAMATSVLMLGMTMGVAAAANYPTPFVVGGSADVAIVYGTGTGVSVLDVVNSGNIQTNLQSSMGSASSGSTSTSISGEVAELFTGGTKLYINDNLNAVKNVITKTSLPTVLADGSFSGNVDATITQTINLGSDPTLEYKKQPETSDDPILGYALSTTSSNYIYNLTASFSKGVNLSHADSEGEELTLFGQTFTISSAGDGVDLVLLKSAEKLSLDSDNPSTDVTIAGESYTIELVSASDTSATVAVTDSSGNRESKEVNEAASKKINGITIAVTTADETNLKLSATVVAGSEKITLTDASEIKIGSDDTAIEGTRVAFTGTPGGSFTKLEVEVAAADSDEDALTTGQEFVDPVFGTVKLSLAGFNIEEDSSDREEITIENDGDDKVSVKFTDHRGYEKAVQFAIFGAGSRNTSLQWDENGGNISVQEMEKLHEGDYVVVGNEDEGFLLRLSNANNATTGYGNDKATFVDVFSGETIDTTFTSHTQGELNIGGRQYTVTPQGKAGLSDSLYNISLNYPDSSGASAILYPTIQTGKGAKIAFYEPVTINLHEWTGNAKNNLTSIKVPNGADTYQTITYTASNETGNVNVTCGGTTYVLYNTITDAQCNITNTGFGYNISTSFAGTTNTTTIRLMNVNGLAEINEPALMIFEEKDDNNIYEGMIVRLDLGANSDNGAGVDDIERTWLDDSTSWENTMASDSKKQQDMDLWGTIITTDSSDSDQKTAVISYPEEQIYALTYMGEESSSIGVTGGSVSAATSLGEVLVKDSEVSSVSSKNLIIVGGSCINSAAATALGVSSGTCGAAFTTATGVGTGEFLIKGVSDAFTTGKIALVVAGYDATDTQNAATYLTTQTVDTMKEYKGTSSTTATMVTTETA